MSMPYRYLFGPASAPFAANHLARAQQAGECLAFNAAGDVDLRIGVEDSWEAVCARLPVDWRPDFIALYLPYNVIPECLRSGTLVRVGLAGDWNLDWHAYRRLLGHCDLVLTDTTGVEVMQREGIAQARMANLYGLASDFLKDPPSPPEDRGSKIEDRGLTQQPRDIDILFVGNLHPAIQRERLGWLARLPALGERWRVVIRTNAFAHPYRDLLRPAPPAFTPTL